MNFENFLVKHSGNYNKRSDWKIWTSGMKALNDSNLSPLEVEKSINLLKGQLISEGNFGVFKSPKRWTFFVRISALASKIGQI